MKNQIENKIKDAFQNLDESSMDLGFDKEKVWNEIVIGQTAKRNRRFYPVAAAVFLLLSSGISYLFYTNQQLKREYRLSLVELQQQKEKVQPPTRAEKVVEYETQIKEVVKESPELKAKFQKLEVAFLALKRENVNLEQQLFSTLTEVESLKDSVLLLQAKDPMPLFTEKAPASNKKEKNTELVVRIDEKALAQLPLRERKKQKDVDRLQVKVIDRNRGIPQTPSPLFSSIVRKK